MSLTIGVTTTVSTESIDALILRFALIPALIEKTANLIVTEMQRLAPYDDRPTRPEGPHLRDTITAHLEAFAAEITAGEGLPDGRAIFNEFGTSRMAAHPYFRPAVERYIPAFLAELQTLLA
jgi:HK97 gp10 family phage protein